jgi:hypothetical protein
MLAGMIDFIARERRGRNPGLARIYLALTQHEIRQAYPEAVGQARAGFPTVQSGT